MKFSFAPVVDQNTRVLLLGSLPGEMSLARGQYYANPRNQFWRLIRDVAGVDLPDVYEERLTSLRALGIGLWDVVRSATRAGSLDAAIRAHAPNALDELVASLPSLRVIAFNGARAAAIGRANLTQRPGLELMNLPSSSPAYTRAFDQKASLWRELRPFLRP